VLQDLQEIKSGKLKRACQKIINLFVDGSHNPLDGARVLNEYLRKFEL
jgi:hypothetical protein